MKGWMVVAWVLAAGPAFAQAMPHGSAQAMPPMDHAAAPAAGAGASTQAFQAADEAMMHGMNVPKTGNADQDFVAGMLPHHQGAVDMAKVELRYGKDPALLRLARGIIRAQEREMAQMRAWQAAHPLPR